MLGVGIGPVSRLPAVGIGPVLAQYRHISWDDVTQQGFGSEYDCVSLGMFIFITFVQYYVRHGNAIIPPSAILNI